LNTASTQFAYAGHDFSFNVSSAFSSNFCPKLFFEPSSDTKYVGWLFPAKHTLRAVDYTMKTSEQTRGEKHSRKQGRGREIFCTSSLFLFSVLSFFLLPFFTPFPAASPYKTKRVLLQTCF